MALAMTDNGASGETKAAMAGVAFDGYRAGFPSICGTTHEGDPVIPVITRVRHKACVAVNEEGTEAAAATAVMVGVTSVSIRRTFRMVIDRPFFWAIRDRQTGVLLFLGSVVDPASG